MIQALGARLWVFLLGLARGTWHVAREFRYSSGVLFMGTRLWALDFELSAFYFLLLAQGSGVRGQN